MIHRQQRREHYRLAFGLGQPRQRHYRFRDGALHVGLTPNNVFVKIKLTLNIIEDISPRGLDPQNRSADK